MGKRITLNGSPKRCGNWILIKGWTRDLQGFHVIVDGQLCPIVGRVSMDQITVRLPKVYPLGTPVTLMGENGGASITATEVAEKRGTINYEVLCLLSDRVPRSYD